MISLKINLFSPWYSWKIAELALNNNNSLTHLNLWTVHSFIIIYFWRGWCYFCCDIQWNSYIFSRVGAIFAVVSNEMLIFFPELVLFLLWYPMKFLYYFQSWCYFCCDIQWNLSIFFQVWCYFCCGIQWNSYIFSRFGAIFTVISNEILHSKLQNVNEQGPVGKIKSGVDGMLEFADNTADVSYVPISCQYI